MKIDKPIFSIIIPTYNRTEFLAETVESVANQTLNDSHEILLIDDGSDEEARNQMKNLVSTDQRVQLLRLEEHAGVSQARNEGLRHCRGKFVLFLDDDDCISKEFLSIAKEALIASDIDIFMGQAAVHPGSNRKSFQYHLLKETFHNHPKNSLSGDLATTLLFPPQINTMVFRRNVFREHQFDNKLKFGEDVKLWSQIVLSGVKFSQPNTDAIGYVRVHNKNTQKDIKTEEMIQFLQDLEREIPKKEIAARKIIQSRILIRYALVGEWSKAFGLLLKSLSNDGPNLQIIVQLAKIKAIAFMRHLLKLP